MDVDILFGLVLTACFLWSTFFLIFTAHFFVATVIDSAAGTRDVSFQADSIIDRLWRPGLCVWILFFWIVMGSILLGPLLGAFRMVFLGVMPIVLWILFPVSLLSILYTQNWLFMIHPKLVWQKLQHGGAMAYVHGVTLAFAALGTGLIALVIMHSFYWAMPAAFILPALILLYARHWGRFAWLALYGERRREKKPKSAEPPMDEETLRTLLAEDSIPEVEVEEFHPEVEGIREGLPLSFPSAIRAAGAIDLGEAPPPEVPSVAPAAESFALEEEEDEFAKDKKPYAVIEPPTPGMDPNLTVSIADTKPTPLSDFYDQQHREEKAKKKRLAAAENRFLPQQTGDPPNFKTALLHGVWEFLLYPSTLHAWAILIALTIVELFFVTMVVRHWPNNNGG